MVEKKSKSDKRPFFDKFEKSVFERFEDFHLDQDTGEMIEHQIGDQDITSISQLVIAREMIKLNNNLERIVTINYDIYNLLRNKLWS